MIYIIYTLFYSTIQPQTSLKKKSNNYWIKTVSYFLKRARISITTSMLTKRMEKKLDSNYTRMLRAVLNKSWRQHPIKQQLYGHLPPIKKTIKVRQTRHVGHWRSKEELISYILQWTPSHGQAKTERPAWTYTTASVPGRPPRSDRP